NPNHLVADHLERSADLARLEAPSGDIITPEYLTACVRRQVGLDAIIVNEGITAGEHRAGFSQSRLEGAEVLDARDSSRGLCQPRPLFAHCCRPLHRLRSKFDAD